MVYEYTKPKVPIAAMYVSPGPAVYTLPTLVGAQTHDPRSVHGKRPAWVFGIKSSAFKDSSPGPVYLPNFKMTRYGQDGTPIYSIFGRVKTPTLFQPPGPGAYSPEKCGPSAAPAAPQFSLGPRVRLRYNKSSPAPNTYTLPTMLGKTVESGKFSYPAWSQYGRQKHGRYDQDFAKAPGPGTYAVHDLNTNKVQNPSYTIRPKLEYNPSEKWKLGPATHSREKVIINKRVAPSFSFGIRHSQYMMPVLLGQEEKPADHNADEKH